MPARDREVGDVFDDGTSLIGCYNHVSALIDAPEDRFEPGLFAMDRDQAFKTLAHSVLAIRHDAEPYPEIYRDTHGRFHLTHIGVTSMDRFVLLFIKSEQGESRFIWRELEGEIHDARVPPARSRRYFRSSWRRPSRTCRQAAGAPILPG